jgi:hypothetical protein
MTFSFYLNQTTKKNQGAQEDLDRVAGNKDKDNRGQKTDDRFQKPEV